MSINHNNKRNMPVYQNETDRINSLLRAERQKCKEDVCPYCAGLVKGYDPTPIQGANPLVDLIHELLVPAPGIERFCKASAIFKRERAEENKQVF